MEKPNSYTAKPKCGLKLRLDHVYPEKRSQDYTPPLKIIWSMLPLIIRYLIYYVKYKLTGKSIVMDYINVQQPKRLYGVPLGGIGSGSIGRGYRGEFCRFQLKPGIYEWNTVEANQFIVTIKDANQTTIFQSLLSCYPKSSLKSWENHIDPAKCFYTGLYPRSWTEYDLSDFGIVLLCRQISPVIPHNYVDSSLPCAVFIWDIKNVSSEERTVTIAFTFKNGTGDKKKDKTSPCSSASFKTANSGGVILHHMIDKMPCRYALAAKVKSDVDISTCLYFDPNSSGIKPWQQLKESGRFEIPSVNKTEQNHGEMGCALATKVSVLPKERKETEMVLVWDMPNVQFSSNEKKYTRMYATHFGKESAVLKIVEYAFNNVSDWEKKISEWQDPVLNDGSLPEWYKGALFNQAYYLSDGGNLWVSLDETEKAAFEDGDIRKTFGRYFYLEGHEYKMCNTYDVHFYASFALQMNWPILQKCIQYDFKDSIFMEIKKKVKMLYDGEWVERKVPNTVPHDTGDPGEAPFTLINSYPIHDVSKWRDLNTKFVLQVLRDGLNDGNIDRDYFNDMYSACYTVMIEMLKYDTDGDGLIENSSSPDQTFDTWVMCGPSAYCGGLWLAALFAMTEIAGFIGKLEDKKKFQTILDKGKQAYEEKLWNGTYYNFDCSKDECVSIMADQLCGHWYLRCCGYGYEVFPKDKVFRSLQTIYENNVKSFFNGNLGAVNGFINGGVDTFTIQSQEVWTGVTYALAASMIQEGMVNEGLKTAEGMFRSLTESGLTFDTPEALHDTHYCRSIGYMRPLSIWSMHLALQKAKS